MREFLQIFVVKKAVSYNQQMMKLHFYSISCALILYMHAVFSVLTKSFLQILPGIHS